MKKIKELDKLATEMVGDGQKPNVFFVTLKGKVTTVTRHFEVAHREWRKFAMQRMESALEDRQTGTIASAGVEPTYHENDNGTIVEGPAVWQVHDDSIMFKFIRKDGDYK